LSGVDGVTTFSRRRYLLLATATETVKETATAKEMATGMATGMAKEMAKAPATASLHPRRQ
jgi:hypothetical protein